MLFYKASTDHGNKNTMPPIFSLNLNILIFFPQNFFRTFLEDSVAPIKVEKHLKINIRYLHLKADHWSGENYATKAADLVCLFASFRIYILCFCIFFFLPRRRRPYFPFSFLIHFSLVRDILFVLYYFKNKMIFFP